MCQHAHRSVGWNSKQSHLICETVKIPLWMDGNASCGGASAPAAPRSRCLTSPGRNALQSVNYNIKMICWKGKKQNKTGRGKCLVVRLLQVESELSSSNIVSAVIVRWLHYFLLPSSGQKQKSLIITYSLCNTIVFLLFVCFMVNGIND